MSLKLAFQSKFCVGCFACESACKQEHALAEGVRWIRVKREERMGNDDKPFLSFSLDVCEHCDDPPCQPVCPSEAIKKQEDGTVLLDPELCTGCQECIEACPYGVITYDEKNEAASKCNLCHHRLERKLAPSCVVNCPGKAINLVE